MRDELTGKQQSGQSVFLRHEMASLNARLKTDSEATSKSDQATELYARCFGSFAVFRHGRPVDLGNSRPVVELCRYLVASAGQLVPCEQLIEMLWPDAPPPQALHRLHVAASTLRRILDEPAVIQFHEESYRIPAETITTDCHRFDAHFTEARSRQTQHNLGGAAQSFRAALALYTDDFLVDRLYADWTFKRRAHFSERRLAAMTFLCEYAVLSHDLASVLDYAQQILAVDNLRERAHRDLMRAHCYLGQRAIALRQYHACMAILREELDVEPSPLTTRVYEAIRDNREPPLEPAVLH